MAFIRHSKLVNKSMASEREILQKQTFQKVCLCVTFRNKKYSSYTRGDAQKLRFPDMSANHNDILQLLKNNIRIIQAGNLLEFFLFFSAVLSTKTIHLTVSKTDTKRGVPPYVCTGLHWPFPLGFVWMISTFFFFIGPSPSSSVHT